jgi:hypothetical protein
MARGREKRTVRGESLKMSWILTMVVSRWSLEMFPLGTPRGRVGLCLWGGWNEGGNRAKTLLSLGGGPSPH